MEVLVVGDTSKDLAQLKHSLILQDLVLTWLEVVVGVERT